MIDDLQAIVGAEHVIEPGVTFEQLKEHLDRDCLELVYTSPFALDRWKAGRRVVFVQAYAGSTSQ